MLQDHAGEGNGFGGGGGRHSSALQGGEVAVTAPRRPEKLPPSRIDDVDDYVELMYDDETKVSRETARAEQRERGSGVGRGRGGGGGSETAFRVYNCRVGKSRGYAK